MSYLGRAEKQEVLRLLFFRDGDRCCWCGRKLIPHDQVPVINSGSLPRNYPTIEHLVKQCHGGPHRPFNLKLSCPPCNSTRDKRMSLAT